MTDNKNNTGIDNSGNRNSGEYNSGYYNSGNRNSGWFNTNEPKMRFFNKDSDITYSEFSKKLIVFPDLHTCQWIDYKDLPKDEQNTDTKNMDGKLVTMDYKGAWAEYWNRASESDKTFFRTLPNFSWEVFTSITGIEQDNPIDNKIIELNGKRYKQIED